MRQVKFNGFLYHRAKSTWESPIDLTRSGPFVALGPGFYTTTSSAFPDTSMLYGPYLKLLELPEEALEGKTAVVSNYGDSSDKMGASISVMPCAFYVVIHDTDLIDAATVHPFFKPTEVFPTSAPK